MDREGPSKQQHTSGAGANDDDRPAVWHRREEDDPADSDEEERRAEVAGAKSYNAQLWQRLHSPPLNRPTIDVWEFKTDGEVMTMTFTCDGATYPMYFTPRSICDYKMRQNTWIPRHDNTYKSLRTRLFSLPKTTTINKLVFFNTPDCEAEDCLIEMMFIKKWTARQLEYNICTEFCQPQHLRKLVHMFKPAEITIFLNFGPYIHSSSVHEPAGMHNHLAAVENGTVELEKDFRVDCAHALNSDPSKKDLSLLYAEAGKGKAFGTQMMRTLHALRKFVTLMVEKRMATTKGVSIRKFVVNGPTADKICPKLQTLLKEDGVEEANRKRGSYASGDKVFVCVRNDLRRAFKYSLAMPATAFKMSMGNEQLLLFTKTVPNFQCLFRTNVDEYGVKQLISEWLKGERNIEEIQLHVDKVFESDFAQQFNPDSSDPKRIKIRRNINDRRSTMYIERERLATRHLSIRVLDAQK